MLLNYTQYIWYTENKKVLSKESKKVRVKGSYQESWKTYPTFLDYGRKSRVM